LKTVGILPKPVVANDDVRNAKVARQEVQRLTQVGSWKARRSES
jgi:hypothetical protein